MLGGRRELVGQIQILQRQVHNLESSIIDLSGQINILLSRSDEKSRFPIPNPIPDPEPVDKYAKMRTSDGLLSYQTYKARKVGLEGRINEV